MNVTTEARLVLQIQDNSQTASDELIIGHRGLVFKLSEKHGHDTEHKQELSSVGDLALCEATRSFVGKERSCRFSTFAYTRIEASMINSLRTFSCGILSATEWEGRSDARLRRQWKELAQDLGRDPTLDEFAFVYEEDIYEKPVPTGLELIDVEKSYPPVNGNRLDMEKLPKHVRQVVDEVSYGASLGEVAMSVSAPREEIHDLLTLAARFIHFEAYVGV